jgi:dTDP-4-amino-4,6-dideoxygalactose transaminase
LNVPVHGSMLDAADHSALIAACGGSAQALWLTAGPRTAAFEKALCERFNRRYALFCNSGSSANLLAMSALELPKGSEVITAACAFPTTVNPIIQCGLVPVFVDCEPGTWNIDTSQLEAALSDKTRAVVVTHMLGNPVRAEAYDWTDRHNIPLISDSCDASGARISGNEVTTFGRITTLSFFPAHQITTGEGGAVLTDDPKLAKIAASYRDWGRACWCEPGHDNTCGKRFAGGYDHKFTYDRIGYNLKATELQAAIGLSQLDKLDGFVAKRRANWQYLYDGLKDLPITLPIATPNSKPSWFGFAFGTEDRNVLARYLDAHSIGSRPLFAGNVLRQPAYTNIVRRVVGDLHNSDYAMDSVLFVGCWPGLSTEQLDYSIQTIRDWFKKG